MCNCLLNRNLIELKGNKEKNRWNIMNKEEFKQLVLTLDELMYESKYIEYLELCEPTIDLGIELHMFKDVLLIMRQVSECYYQLGHIDTAIEKLVPLKKMIADYGTEEDYIYFLNLSYIYWDETGDKEHAGSFLYKALPLARLGKHRVMLRKILNNLTALHIMTGKYTEAYNYALETRDLLQQEFRMKRELSPSDYMPPLINHAVILERLNRLEECEKILAHGFKHVPENRIISRLNLMFTLSEVRRKQERFDEQLSVLLEARTLALKHQFTTNSIEILQALIEFYTNVHDVEALIEVQQQYIEVLEKAQQQDLKIRLSKVEQLTTLRVDRRAFIDPLTKVYNRKYFERTYYADLKGRTYLFCFLDIEHFNIYNEQNGQLAGNELLKQFAYCAGELFNDKGLFARYYGDRFYGIIPCDDKDVAMRWLTQLQRAFITLPVNVRIASIYFEKDDGTLLAHLVDYAKKHLTRANPLLTLV